MDDNVTESKEAKAQTLAKMRDKKDVSLVPIDERLQSSSHELEFVQKDGGELTPKDTHSLGEPLPNVPVLLPAWIGSGFGSSEGKKGYGCVSVVPLVMTCFRRSGLTEISPVNGRL